MRGSALARNMAPTYACCMTRPRSFQLSAVMVAVIACTGDSRVEVAVKSDAIRGGSSDALDVAVVGISDSASGATCTGALIAPNLVLTAQHCVARPMGLGPCTQGTFGPPGVPANLFVTTRAVMTFNPGDYHRVAEIVIPPGGDGFCGRDIALLRLANNVAASESAPIAPRVDRAPAAAEPYAAVGFGATDENNTGSGERRRRDGLAVACVGVGCASQSVAAAEWTGEAGVCQGDSGGPALDGAGRVIGVASRGAVGCIAPIYTEIRAHTAWLVAEAIRAAATGGYPPPQWTGSGPTSDASVDATADATVDATADATADATVAIDATVDAGVAINTDTGGCHASRSASGNPFAVIGVLLAGRWWRSRRQRAKGPASPSAEATRGESDVLFSPAALHTRDPTMRRCRCSPATSTLQKST